MGKTDLAKKTIRGKEKKRNDLSQCLEKQKKGVARLCHVAITINGEEVS